jgi:hypothetical protein
MAIGVWVRVGVGSLFACAFAYVLWLSNAANRETVQMLRATGAEIRYGQFKQQNLLNRVEYRLARTSSKYLELERAFGEQFAESIGGGGRIAEAAAQSPYQSTLQKASKALKESDMQTALEMLTKTHHKLLDQLNLVEERKAGNSTGVRAVKAALQREVRRCCCCGGGCYCCCWLLLVWSAAAWHQCRFFVGVPGVE